MNILLEAAVRATFLAASCALLISALRITSAKARHALWTAVLLTMLALPVWRLFGLSIPVRIFRASPVATALAQPISLGTATSLPDQGFSSESSLSPGWDWSRVFTLLYVAGCLPLTLRLIAGTWQARALTKRATRVRGRLTSAEYVTPVTTGLFVPRVILPAAWQHWSREHLEAILAHEEAHVRRRDPLVHWLALLNRAVFWFHPLAWWMARHHTTLAEEACDDAVIATGTPSVAYAEALLLCAEAASVAGGRFRVGVTMPGRGLSTRMARILSGEAPRQTARWRFASACAIGVAVGATCVAATLEQVTADQPTVDLTWSRAQTELPSFDVASIKPNRGSDAPTTLFPLGPGDAYAATGGLFRAVNQPLIAYVRFAYRMGPGDELLNLPRWVSEERFDIQARTDTNPSKDQMRLLVRSLLMDRFGLGVHTEQRTQAIYDLIVAERGRLGPQIRPHATDANCKGELVPLEADAPSASAPTTQPPSMFQLPTLPCGSIGFITVSSGDNGRMVANGEPMDKIAGVLRGPFTGIDRHIRNRTGLSGTFDFSLEWSRQAEFASPDTAPGDTGPRFAEALRTQLGLTLRSARGPVDVLVIDRIDRPTAD